jgi:hypothetical protein
VKRTIAVLLTVLALTGCSIRIRTGRLPDVKVLENQLQIGTSTAAEVRRLLGEPYARGRSLLPPDPAKRPTDLWTYTYGEGDLEDSRQIVLFVFLDQDVFLGYMWFSSLPAIQPPPTPPVR